MSNQIEPGGAGGSNQIEPGKSLLLLDREEVTCPICLDILYRPILTPCGHDYCRHCIERVISNTPLFEPNHCPLCREDFDQFAVNPRLKTQIDRTYPEDVDRRKRVIEAEESEEAGRVARAKRQRQSMFLIIDNSNRHMESAAGPESSSSSTSIDQRNNFWNVFLSSFDVDPVQDEDSNNNVESSSNNDENGDEDDDDEDQYLMPIPLIGMKIWYCSV